MTRRAARRGGTIPRLWLLPILGLTTLLGVTVAGVLSRSIVLDLIAWWPVWLLMVILVVVVRGRRLGRVRVSGLMPLLTVAVLGVFLLGHLTGWPIMPSASQRLVGAVPQPDVPVALSVRIDGDIVVSSGGEFLYVVTPVRRGGTIGIPDASEQTQGEALSVVLSPPPDPGFYAFSGWDIRLSPAPAWSLTIEGVVSADLTGLAIDSLQVLGEGTLTLPATDGPTPATIGGSYTLIVPAGVAARVVGDAVVPASWERLSDGWRSPASGDGWVISPTEAGTLTVEDG